MNGKYWNGKTFAEKVAGMQKAYTVTSVSDSDTCIVLEDWQSAGQARMVVAHISAAGWVDVFIGHIADGRPQEDESRHVALTPSQFETLLDAYNVHTARAIA